MIALDGRLAYVVHRRPAGSDQPVRLRAAADLPRLLPRHGEPAPGRRAGLAAASDQGQPGRVCRIHEHLRGDRHDHQTVDQLARRQGPMGLAGDRRRAGGAGDRNAVRLPPAVHHTEARRRRTRSKRAVDVRVRHRLRRRFAGLHDPHFQRGRVGRVQFARRGHRHIHGRPLRGGDGSGRHRAHGDAGVRQHRPAARSCGAAWSGSSSSPESC